MASGIWGLSGKISVSCTADILSPSSPTCLPPGTGKTDDTSPWPTRSKRFRTKAFASPLGLSALPPPNISKLTPSVARQRGGRLGSGVDFDLGLVFFLQNPLPKAVTWQMNCWFPISRCSLSHRVLHPCLDNLTCVTFPIGGAHNHPHSPLGSSLEHPVLSRSRDSIPLFYRAIRLGFDPRCLFEQYFSRDSPCVQVRSFVKKTPSYLPSLRKFPVQSTNTTGRGKSITQSPNPILTL